jgi:hypothetical protein
MTRPRRIRRDPAAVANVRGELAKLTLETPHPGGMPQGWYIIRVELISGLEGDVETPPGRDLLASPNHTFRQLADTINATLRALGPQPPLRLPARGWIRSRDPRTYDAVRTLREIVVDSEADAAVRIKAAELILDRTLGKAPQHVAIDVTTGDMPAFHRMVAAALVGTEDQVAQAAQAAHGEIIDAELVEDEDAE